MTRALQSIHSIGHQTATAVRRSMHSHRILMFFFLLIGLPILSLAAIYAACAAVLFPLAWLCGWL